MTKFINSVVSMQYLMKSIEALWPHLEAMKPMARSITALAWPRRRTPWGLMAGAFGAGVAVGAAAATFTAPKSGAELRSDVKLKAGELASGLRDKARSLRRSQANGHADSESVVTVSAG